MYREKVGIITQKENDELLQVYERKLALQDLLTALDSQTFTEEEKNELYSKIVTDLEKTKTNVEKNWYDLTQKYQWNPVQGRQCNIDFNTCEIFLVESNQCAG